MTEVLMPIGMFSRASSLSIKTLRAYHEAGILVPDSVDPRTGYRAYGVSQLGDAAVIVRLRALHLPLCQVRDVLLRRDPEFTEAVLAGHAATTRRRLAELEKIMRELGSTEAPVTHTPVHVRDEPASHTLRVRGRIVLAECGEWLGCAYGRLAAALATAGVTPVGPASGLYAAEIADDGPEEVEAYYRLSEPFPIPAGEREVGIGEVPAATVAVLVHVGDYHSIGDTYRALGAWVAGHAKHRVERVREHYLVGPAHTSDEAAFRTEICWPVEPV